MLAPISSPSRNLLLLLVFYFQGREQSNGVHLSFPTNSPHSTSQGLSVRILLVAKYVIPIMYSQTWELTTGWVQGPIGLTVGWTAAQTPIT